MSSLFAELAAQTAQGFHSAALPILVVSIIIVLFGVCLSFASPNSAAQYNELMRLVTAQIMQKNYLAAAVAIWVIFLLTLLLVLTIILIVFLQLSAILPLLAHVVLYVKITLYLSTSTEIRHFQACGIPLAHTYVHFYLVFSLVSPTTVIYALMLCLGKRLRGHAHAEILAFSIFFVGYLFCLVLGARVFHTDRCPVIRETQAYQMASAKLFLSLYEFFILLLIWICILYHKFTVHRETREASYVEVSFQEEAAAATTTTTPPPPKQSYDSFGSSPAVFLPVRCDESKDDDRSGGRPQVIV